MRVPAGAAVFLLLVAGCRPGTVGPTPDPGGGGPVLFVAGEERGYLEPCGCTRPQLGGLARKATAIGGAPLFENGDLVDRPGRLAQLKFEAFLLALSEIGARALNVGEKDLALGLDFLRSAAGMARFPLISANILDESGEPAFGATAEFREDGRTMLAIGVLDPAVAPGVRLADPVAAVTAWRPIVDPDFVLLLFHGSAERAKSLFADEGWIDAVVCAHGNGEPDARDPRFVGPGDRSRWMIRLGGGSARVVTLSEDIPNDPRMERALATYVSRLRVEDLLHRMNPQAPPAGGGFTGDAACAACHEATMRTHGATAHARAIESIRKTGRHVDPDCVACHVVGYGERTGFLSVEETPGLARVGCESCHGPGREHAASPMNVKPGRDARASCSGCHTEDTDPDFEFERKWPGIRHE